MCMNMNFSAFGAQEYRDVQQVWIEPGKIGYKKSVIKLNQKHVKQKTHNRIKQVQNL